MFFFKKHVIVIGLSRIGTQIAINLSKAGRNVVVISNEPLGPDAEVIKRNGGFVILSKGFDERTLKRAGLANASTVFIASSNDDINIKLAQFISRLKKRKYFYGTLKLMVHINNSDLKNLLSDYLDISSGDSIDLQPFSINDVAAKLVYDQYPPHLYLVDQTAKDNEKII
jgi:NAD(P)-dependent dehydrogenase (short-subunit alcohol dehydrogenase family)